MPQLGEADRETAPSRRPFERDLGRWASKGGQVVEGGGVRVAGIAHWASRRCRVVECGGIQVAGIARPRSLRMPCRTGEGRPALANGSNHRGRNPLRSWFCRTQASQLRYWSRPPPVVGAARRARASARA